MWVHMSPFIYYVGLFPHESDLLIIFYVLLDLSELHNMFSSNKTL